MEAIQNVLKYNNDRIVSWSQSHAYAFLWL